jgi:hypothetical protein
VPENRGLRAPSIEICGEGLLTAIGLCHSPQRNDGLRQKFWRHTLMEMTMRLYPMLSMASCMMAGAILVSVPAAADWHRPYIHRETSGSWTNSEYDDGVCRIYYSHNDYDNNTKIDRRGDCSHVIIDPDGTPRYTMPFPNDAY